MKSNERQSSPSTLGRKENPRLKLDLPTPHELPAAIRVLEKFSDWLKQGSAHSVLKMPNSPLGNQYAASIGENAAAKTDQIKAFKIAVGELATGAEGTAEATCIKPNLEEEKPYSLAC